MGICNGNLARHAHGLPVQITPNACLFFHNTAISEHFPQL